MSMRPKVLHKLTRIGPGWDDAYLATCGRRILDDNAVRKTWRGVTCKNCLRRKTTA